MQKSEKQLPIGLNQIKQLFRISIIKINKLKQLSKYYEAVTAVGTMSLLIQQFLFDGLDKGKQIIQRINQRNKILQTNFKCFPIIYQKHVIQYLDKHVLSLILMQQCQPLTEYLLQSFQRVKISYFNKLIRNIQFIQKNEFSFRQQIKQSNVLFLKNSQQIITDLDLINFMRRQQLNQKDEHKDYFPGLISFIKQILNGKYKHNQIAQIIFIRGKVYVFQPQKLSQATDYQQLIFFLNLSPNLEVKLLAKSANNEPRLGNKLNCQINNNSELYSPLNKPRILNIKQLENNPVFSMNSRIFQSLHFIDGKCINCLREVFYQQLKQKFIKDGALYKLQQFQHLIVNLFDNSSEENKRRQQVVTVYPPVAKSDLIGFLIAYIKCVQPTITRIQYLNVENTLRLTYQNRKRQIKYLNIVFYEQYTVKDEQISMILQKSNIVKCKLNLKKMKISDSFLIFMSHFQKTLNVQQIFLDDNHGISDVGLTTFLKSPFSKNIKTLSLSMNNQQNSLLEQSVQLISKKQNLQKLYINKSGFNRNILDQQIDISTLKLIELQSLGVKLTLNSVVKASLKILRLDQMVPVQQLKNIKHLRLVQLKVKLNQFQKKSLMDSISGISSLTSLTSSLTMSISKNFNTKAQAVKIFAQGESKQTLKKLDISGSNCKFKTIHPLLLMNSLQSVILDQCINLGSEFQPISSTILSVSFLNVQLGLDHLLTIFNKINVLLQLNIVNTNMKKHEVLKFFSTKKIFISNLIISEIQYSNKLLDITNGCENIQSIQIYVDRILQPEQEYSLNSLLSKGTKSQKSIHFVLQMGNNLNEQKIERKKQMLIDRINKYLIMSNEKIDCLQNLYINKMKILDILELQENYQVNDSCQSLVASYIKITSNGCSISSLPKIVIRKQCSVPILFRVLQTETINKLTHRFVKFMHQNQLPVSINLNSNKLIGKQILSVFSYYGLNLIRQISFKDCMFTMNEAIDNLFQLTGIQVVNNGQCQIFLNKDNFSKRSQKYIKFFMRLKPIESLKIECQDIEQTQILCSVLGHILQYNKQNLKHLSITFYQINLGKQSLLLIKSLFQLEKLLNFQLLLKQGEVRDKTCLQLWHRNFNDLKQLQKLNLSIPTILHPVTSLNNLKQLCLQFSDGSADDNLVCKSVRGIQNSKYLKVFKLWLPNCPYITNVSKIFGILPVGLVFEKLPELQSISLNFQYCSLKDQTLIDLICQIPNYQSLKIFELNISFAITNFIDVLNSIQSVIDQFAQPISIKIICVTQNSRTYLLQTQSLSQKGIQFIL